MWLGLRARFRVRVSRGQQHVGGEYGQGLAALLQLDAVGVGGGLKVEDGAGLLRG